MTIQSGAQIDGVLYLINDETTTISGSGSLSLDTIIGGLVSHGDVEGLTLLSFVRHDPVYMNYFAAYLSNPNARVVKIIKWLYE